LLSKENVDAAAKSMLYDQTREKFEIHVILAYEDSKSKDVIPNIRESTGNADDSNRMTPQLAITQDIEVMRCTGRIRFNTGTE
jgi:hypothetical protein